MFVLPWKFSMRRAGQAQSLSSQTAVSQLLLAGGGGEGGCCEGGVLPPPPPLPPPPHAASNSRSCAQADVRRALVRWLACMGSCSGLKPAASESPAPDARMKPA